MTSSEMVTVGYVDGWLFMPRRLRTLKAAARTAGTVCDVNGGPVGLRRRWFYYLGGSLRVRTTLMEWSGIQAPSDFGTKEAAA